MDYHHPVMLEECLEALNIDPKGTYVDVTFGGGGHSKAILAQLDGGKLFAFDQDPDAAEQAQILKQSLSPEKQKSFEFIPANFSDLKRYLKLYQITQVDGILADLGISSHQIDTPTRGFSYRYDAPLDMRMNTRTGISARELIEQSNEQALTDIFRQFGEITSAWRLANKVKQVSQTEALTTGRLTEIAEEMAPKGQRAKYLSQVFQALRMVVNQEIDVLRAFLEQTGQVIQPDGRLVIMAYHSLEDRLVKNYLREGKLEGEAEKDFYGNITRAFKPLKSKPVEPNALEVERNPRSRSAKLRVGVKNP